MSIDRREHWDAAYAQGEETRSWFQESPTPSLAAIESTGVNPDEPVIDVGGGASRLVDALLERGFADITVLDVSPVALDIARTRLGERADRVHWLATDLLQWQPDRTYAVWHDRAVLHFLRDEGDRSSYASTLNRATRPGSRAVFATFAPDGPEQCSGLPVQRHDAASLAELLGADWSLESDQHESHRTPAGGIQSFTWATFRRVP